MFHHKTVFSIAPLNIYSAAFRKFGLSYKMHLKQRQTFPCLLNFDVKFFCSNPAKNVQKDSPTFKILNLAFCGNLL